MISANDVHISTIFINQVPSADKSEDNNNNNNNFYSTFLKL